MEWSVSSVLLSLVLVLVVLLSPRSEKTRWHIPHSHFRNLHRVLQEGEESSHTGWLSSPPPTWTPRRFLEDIVVTAVPNSCALSRTKGDCVSSSDPSLFYG